MRRFLTKARLGLRPDELFLTGKDLLTNLEKPNRIELRTLGKTAAAIDEEFNLNEGKSPRVSKGADGVELENTLRNSFVASRRPLFLFPAAEKSTDFEIGSRSTRKFHGNLKEFAGESLTDGQFFVFLAHGIAERFSDILRDYNVVLDSSKVSIGNLSGGFEIPSLKLTIYTENDIFGESNQNEFGAKTKDKRSKTKISAFVSDFRDLKSGDYVVHVDHGIGRFEGLQTLETGGVSREFMLLDLRRQCETFCSRRTA